MYDVYIGDLTEGSWTQRGFPHAFKWEGGSWSGNVPRRLSPSLPDDSLFREILRRIEVGELIGKQTDWGGWVARASKEEISTFLDRFYENSRVSAYGGAAMLKAVRACLADLPDAEYALVACEMY